MRLLDGGVGKLLLSDEQENLENNDAIGLFREHVSFHEEGNEAMTNAIAAVSSPSPISVFQIVNTNVSNHLGSKLARIVALFITFIAYRVYP